MDSYEYGELLKTLRTKCQNICAVIKPESLERELADIEKKELDPHFWEDTKVAGNIGRYKSRVLKILQEYREIERNIKDCSELFDLASSQNDSTTLELLFADSTDLENSVLHLELFVMLSEPHDALNAIVTIQPGAGGTESQDWASMLYRMYLRWCERRGFKVEILDYQDGEEAGIKGVAFIIKGENAYGYAKAENGVHRLVRISPFDANAKRHTSFASVQVSPEVDDDIDIVIEPTDSRIDTYRASGAGGQHVNKTESAIRITHLPTGIVVQCQNDRSQHKNKATALKMLKSKLYDLEHKKQQDGLNTQEKSEIGWGHQIRSYVLAPYQQVKDLRSQYTTSDTNGVLDGDIDRIIESVLMVYSKN